MNLRIVRIGRQSWWRDVVKDAAMFIVDDQQQRDRPKWAVAESRIDIGDESLTLVHWKVWMLTVRENAVGYVVVVAGLNERVRRKIAVRTIAPELIIRVKSILVMNQVKI